MSVFTVLAITVTIVLSIGTAATSATAAEFSLSGRVTADESSVPLEGVLVTATNTEDGYGRTAYTASDGTYLMEMLNEGWYRVSFSLEGYVQEYYDDVRDPSQATLVQVVLESPETSTGIDASLAREAPQPEAGTVSGTVTDQDSGEPLADGGVIAWDIDDPTRSHGSAQTDTHGRYTMALPAGRYVISGSASDRESEFHRDRPMWEWATVVTVESGSATSDVDFALRRDNARVERVSGGIGYRQPLKCRVASGNARWAGSR